MFFLHAPGEEQRQGIPPTPAMIRSPEGLVFLGFSSPCLAELYLVFTGNVMGFEPISEQVVLKKNPFFKLRREKVLVFDHCGQIDAITRDADHFPFCEHMMDMEWEPTPAADLPSDEQKDASGELDSGEGESP